MLILALDTATAVCGVALAEDETVLVEYSERGGSHAARLMPLAEAALAAAGRDRRELAGVAASLGPGSYTGLRIGLATAQALAFALGVPAAGVGSLEALAYAGGIRDGLVCPMIDARRGRVYTALYRWDGGDLVAVREPCVAAVEDWLAPLAGAEVFFTGEAALLHRERVWELVGRGAAVAAPPLTAARPAAVAALGWRRLVRGKGCPPDGLRPLYLSERRGVSPPA